MWNWLQENHGVVAAIASVLTLIVWVLYFQILLGSYQHRLRPKILINRGGGRTVDAKCIVTNMSAEPIYIEGVIVSLRDGKTEDVVCSLSDLDVEQTDDADLPSELAQGPLTQGEMINLGSYRSIMERAAGKRLGEGGGAEFPEEFSIMVVATYTAEIRPAAAVRVFRTSINDGRCLLTSPTFAARQIHSRRNRKKLERMLEDDDRRPIQEL